MKLIIALLSIAIPIWGFTQLPKLENGKLILDKQVTFKTGTSDLTDEGKEALQQVREFLNAKDYITTLRIEGHSDNSNIEASNQTLTEQRALAACKWLVANGIDCKRLMAVGFGSTKPIESNDTPAGKAQNRRMEFIPAAMKGRAIGGMPLDGGGKVAGDVCVN